MPTDRSWSRNEWARNEAELAVETVATLDMDAAEQAFHAEPGEFADKLIAAVRAATLAALEYETEKHLRIPENPESLTVAALDAMVRPFRTRFLRSQLSKPELIAELASIDRRQRRHAEWAPFELVDPLPPPPGPSRHLRTQEDRDRKTDYERFRAKYVEEL
ncbi:hypothetical protein ACIA8G_11965 [Lentzea sp. NPDC051213]|uniref:hypothetical protein n=1 Tax=Lentzea sp. NPDC051213 TaxID=3364126 RepID=UPI003789A906